MGQIVEYFGFQADSDNLPLPRPGVYQLINQVNGKSYIGISQNVARRIRQHVDGKLKKLGNALRKHRSIQFLIHPIAYSIDDKTDWLPALELQLIAEFDSIKNGYNVTESAGKVGPYGEEFSRIQRDAAPRTPHTPERRALQSKVITEVSNRPEIKQRFLELQKKLWSDPNYKPDRSWQQKFASDKNSTFQQGGNKAKSSPEAKERGRVRMVARYSNPEERTKQSERLKNYLSDPDVYQKRVEQMATVTQLGTDAAAKVISGSIWITDGTINRRFDSDQALPIGFSIGRTNFGNLGRKPKKLRRAVL